jgi:hypothetical protein
VFGLGLVLVAGLARFKQGRSGGLGFAAALGLTSVGGGGGKGRSVGVNQVSSAMAAVNDVVGGLSFFVDQTHTQQGLVFVCLL